MADELARFRVEGIAVCDEEQAAGVRSIAKAVVYPNRPQQVAISVTAPAHEYTVSELRDRVEPDLVWAATRAGIAYEQSNRVQ